MDIYHERVDEPWSEMSSVTRGLSIGAVIAAALVINNALGGWTGFLVGFVIALVCAVIIPMCWRAFHQ